MIKGRKVGLSRTLVTLLHKMLWTVAEGLWTMTRKKKKRRKRKCARGIKAEM